MLKKLTLFEIKRKYPRELIPGQFYKDNKCKLLWRCLAGLGHPDYLQSYNKKQASGRSCPRCGVLKCSNAKRLSIVKISKKYPDIVLDQEYINSEYKIWWKCLANRGHENYLQTYGNRTQNHGCPRCQESRGEKRIFEYLNTNGYSFVRQKKFDSCKNLRHLPFDFCLETERALIEYQGEQHYSKGRYRDAEIRFVKIQKRDRIKKRWAKKNGWTLIIIPYTVKNIESFLDKRLKKILGKNGR